MVTKFWHALRDGYQHYQTRAGVLMSASVAFYALLSMSPLVVISSFVAGLIVGHDNARRGLSDALSHQLGGDWAEVLTKGTTFVFSSSDLGSGMIATIAGIAFSLFASSRLFFSIEQGLEVFWSHDAKRQPRKALPRTLLRLTIAPAAGLVLVTAIFARFLLDTFAVLLPDFLSDWATRLSQELTIWLCVAVITGFLFRYKSKGHLSWRGSAIAGGMTGLFITFVAFVAGSYLRNYGVRSAIGGAGTSVVLLLWAYYTAQAFFLGASFTWAAFNKEIEPTDRS